MGGHVHRAAATDRAGGEAGVTVRVYGRTEYAEPLTELGTIDDESDVRAAFEGNWVELVTFPEVAMQWIIRDGEEIEDA
jgi:hypothetical protein